MTPASFAGLPAYPVATVRAAEERALATVAEGALMQRAAAALAVTCARELARTGRVAGRRAVLLVGAGNNGGDALWAGARLRARGVAVTALLTSGKAHPEGLAALRAAGGTAVAAPSARADRAVAGAELVVDGLVGLGGRPGLREPAAALVERIPAGAVVVAVDVPSGVDVDTGATPAAHVRADVTVTFGAAKPCLLLPPASVAAGRVQVVDLGFDHTDLTRPKVERLRAAEVAALWPVPGAGDDKYRRGVLGMVAGSAGYPGAAVLATAGALAAGVGMVRYVGPGDAAAAVRSAHPEIVAGAGRVQAWALGSGVDPAADDGQPGAVRAALDSGRPCLVDAGALPLLGPSGEDRSDRLLLTPHAGELATLLGRHGIDVDRADVEARPYEHARRAAEVTGACVLLKGATTLVVLPNGRSRSQADGPPWLATAGAGDVLAGIAGALLAAGLHPLDAGSVAAAVHGRAAARASGALDGAPGGPIAASDIARHVTPAVAHLLP